VLLPLVELLDWLPVLAVVELDELWLPVVELVELESDWSPVDVVLSMLSVERPRRSIDGLNVEDEPERSFVLLEVEPVTEELVLELEPVLPALDAVDDVVGEFIDEAPEPDGVDDVPLRPLVDPTVAEDAFAPGEAAAESGMQSMCTGLEECSLARPVFLSASLPAFGLFSVLHNGLEAVAVEPELVAVFAAEFAAWRCEPCALVPVLVLEGDFACEVLLVVAASAGVDSTAATARTLRNWERIMEISLRSLT